MYGATLDEAKPWISNFEQRIELMIQKIESRFPGGCQIYLANIFDPTDGIGDTTRARLPEWKDAEPILNAYNDVISRCAQKHPNVHAVDIHAAFLGHGIHCTQFWRANYDWHDPHYWLYDNLEDPNERGYDAMRESQRDSVPKPRVARQELPWVNVRKKIPTATRLRPSSVRSEIFVEPPHQIILQPRWGEICRS
jgi:hypothetical protein